ncbi:hypothetical protein ABBQ38_013503 [Trebouxia sp. C0009 RCD-2024]
MFVNTHPRRDAMEHPWMVKAHLVVPLTLIAVFLTAQMVMASHNRILQLIHGLLLPWFIYSLSLPQDPGFARRYRKLVALYILPMEFLTFEWRPVLDAVGAVWPSLVKVGIAGGLILLSWQQLPRLRARVLL